MNTWLQNFAYRIGLGVDTFLLSALLALAIAIMTVTYQAVKAAVANPVESLKYE
jgi:putative ABC transport system permease protein